MWRGRLYGDGEGSSCSVNRKLTAIEALADMLGHMKRGVMFDLKINEINIANYINRGFLGKWKQNGWKTVGGARVKYAEEWKKCVLNRMHSEQNMFMIWRYRHERRVGRLLAAEKRQEEKAEKHGRSIMQAGNTAICVPDSTETMGESLCRSTT